MFKNLYFWFKEIWSTRTFDQNYIYSMLKRNIEYFYQNKPMNDEIITCINSLDRLKEENYVDFSDTSMNGDELFRKEDELIKNDLIQMVKIFKLIEEGENK